MKVRLVGHPLVGEIALAAQPALTPSVDADWRRRLHLTTGRSLSHLALETEQEGRAGRAALFGQSLTPGVLGGLVAALVVPSAAGPRVEISAGAGLAASGEDVRLTRRIEAALGRVPLVLSDEDVTDLDAAVAAGKTFAQVLVLVLQPALVEQAAEDDRDPCEPAPEDLAFEDRRRVDAARLELHPWPDGAPPAESAAWRSEVAHAIFARERAAPERGPLGLFARGVPLATIGIAVTGGGSVPAWELRFLDRHSVRRAGGGRRRRPPRVGLEPGSSALFRARVDQLADELADLHARLGPARTSESLLERMRAELRRLPPAGFLPKEVCDLEQLQSGFFDGELELDVVPAPLEQLDALARPSLGLDPIDLAAGGRVRLVVPVPQAVYEPGLLQTPAIEREFYEKLSELDLDRDAWIARRSELRGVRNSLALAVDGRTLDFPEPDPDAVGEVVIPPEIVTPETRAGGERERFSSPRFAIAPTPAEVEAHVEVILGDPRKEGSLRRELSALRIASDPGRDGLPAVIDELEERIARNREKLEAGFLNAAAGQYRLRQFLLGNQAATRLATSDTTGRMSEGLHVQADRHDLSAYYEAFARRGATGIVRAGARTTSQELFERPLSTASWELGRSLRADVLRDMLSGGLELDPAIELPGFQSKKEVGGRVRLVEEQVSVRRLLEDLRGGGTLLEQIRGGAHDNLEEDDEAERFRAGTRALDVTRSILRTWEARLRDYERALLRVKEALRLLRRLVAPVAQELERVDGELAEARHDLRAGLELLRQEEARVERLRLRREAALAEHFRQIFYYRPRALEAGDERAPLRTLLPGDLRDSVPECRDQAADAPPDVVRMVELFEESPLGWFPELKPLLVRIPRLPTLVDLLRSAKARAAAPPLAPISPPKSSPTPLALGLALPAAPLLSKSAQAAAKIVSAQARLVTAARQSRAALELGPLLLASWNDLRREAETAVTIADLLAGREGPPTAKERAARFLEGVRGAAACLHQAVAALSPAIRLEWTRRVSELDTVRSLRDLARLPDWERIEDEVQRRRLQRLVDALYALVDPGVAQAVALVTDLVRVAILATSHSPVNAILAGHVRAPTSVAPGGLVPVIPRVPELTRVGMGVRFYAGTRLVAQGHVVDALVDHVTVEVLDVPRQPADPAPLAIALDAATQVQFVEIEALEARVVPARPRGALAGSAAGALLAATGSRVR